MKIIISTTIAAALVLGVQPAAGAATLSATICPGKITYNSNQEGTLSIFYPAKRLVAKVLPEGPENGDPPGSGFQEFNSHLTYKVSVAAITGMKSTLDLAASMSRAVIVYYEGTPKVTIYAGTVGNQIWSITGPLSKSSSRNCVE